MSAAKAAIAGCALMWAFVLGDVVIFGHGMDVLGIPMIPVFLSSVGALWGVLQANRAPSLAHGHSSMHSVTPIQFTHPGNPIFMILATLLLLISPNVGLPALGMSIAGFRGARRLHLVAIGVAIVVVMELILRRLLGIELPLLPGWGTI